MSLSVHGVLRICLILSIFGVFACELSYDSLMHGSNKRKADYNKPECFPVVSFIIVLGFDRQAIFFFCKKKILSVLASALLSCGRCCIKLDVHSSCYSQHYRALSLIFPWLGNSTIHSSVAGGKNWYICSVIGYYPRDNFIVTKQLKTRPFPTLKGHHEFAFRSTPPNTKTQTRAHKTSHGPARQPPANEQTCCVP